MGGAAIFLAPRGISVSHLSQVGLPVSAVFGKIGLAILLFGMGIAIFGAALETAMSAGYILSQYFGWQWGKFVRPSEAPRFHLSVLVTILLGACLALTTVDPVKVTEYSIVLSAAALPLTYFPILVVANDPDYMGDKTNSPPLNAIAFAYPGNLTAQHVYPATGTDGQCSDASKCPPMGARFQLDPSVDCATWPRLPSTSLRA